MIKIENGYTSFILILFTIFFIGLVFLVYTRINQSRMVDPLTTHPVENIEINESKQFTFTAAGDFSSSSEASTVLSGISKSKSDFTLALGDLGYGKNGNEKIWCDFVLNRIGNDHPFELIVGNHDDGTGEGDISEYAKCLPNKINNITGDYATEYYFDKENLARFILISPSIENYGFDYTEGSEHLQWLIDSIDQARKLGIKWIILGMHKNCITPGVKKCEIGEDLLNTAINLNVDIILQGHEHAYFRSKQLALNNKDCLRVIANSYDKDCESNSSNEFKKGEGTVIVISGAGGYRLREVNFEDEEFNYFSSINAVNSGNSYGFSLFTISEDELKSTFVPTVGDFTDSFTIR